MVVGLATLLYYGWTIYQVKKANQEITDIQRQISDSSASIQNQQGKEELFTRQGQLKELDNIINKHVYWTQLMPELARVTLKTATYSNLTIGGDGTINLDAAVPTLADLDKFMQVFDLPVFNNNFSDVRIGSFHEEQ